MFSSLLLKTLYDKRWFLIGWSFGATALFVLTALFYPAIKDSIGEMFKSVPPAMSSLLGEVSNYQTYEGYLGSAVYGLRAEMLYIPMAILLGIGLGVSEESRGKLYQLLAQPISRLSVGLQKWVAGVIVIVLITAIAHIGIIVASLMIDQPVPHELLLKISTMLVVFGVALFTVTFGLGLGTGRKNIAMFLPIAWTMLSLIVEAFSSMVDWLQVFEPYSLMTYFNTTDMVDNPIDQWHVVVLAAITLIMLIVGLLGFWRRDIRDNE